MSHKDISLTVLCGLFGKSRQGWYQLVAVQDQKILQRALILEEVHQIRSVLPRSGGIKLHSMLGPFKASHLISMGRDALFTLLKEQDLLIKCRRSFIRTNDSFHHFKWPDLVQRRRATRAEEIWVSDITYLRTKKGFVYLSLVTDAWSRKTKGYHLAGNLKADGCIKACGMALKKRIYPNRPLIHHSDRGIQYCCDAYVQMLQSEDVQISMTQSGSPYDNAIAERVNGILKQEFDLHHLFDTYAMAKEKVSEAILNYNQLRPHFACGLKTPQYKHTSLTQKSTVK